MSSYATSCQLMPFWDISRNNGPVQCTITAMTRESLIRLEDVDAIVVQCSTCTSQVRVAINAKLGNSAQVPKPLECCPVCQVRFGDSLKSTLDDLQRALGVLRGLSATIAFQTKVSFVSTIAEVRFLPW